MAKRSATRPPLDGDPRIVVPTLSPQAEPLVRPPTMATAQAPAMSEPQRNEAPPAPAAPAAPVPQAPAAVPPAEPPSQSNLTGARAENPHATQHQAPPAPTHVSERAFMQPPEATVQTGTDLAVAQPAHVTPARSEVPEETHGQEAFGRFAAPGVEFQALGLGTPAAQTRLPKRREKRTAHLAFRTTETYLANFRRRQRVISAFRDCDPEVVTTAILNVLDASFPAIDAEVDRLLAEQDGDE